MDNVESIGEIFRSVETRDAASFAQRCAPDLELHWPVSLPYGGVARGLEPRHPSWGDTWTPLQPTHAQRRMDPRIVAANADEVVVLWHQRGTSATGETLDMPVLGLYRFVSGKLARGQMFYFDTAEVTRFLTTAR